MARRHLSITLPELVTVAATRGMIGVGAGLLLSNLLSRNKRKAIGAPLLVTGLLSTIPIAMHIFHKENPNDEDAAIEGDGNGI